MYDNQLIELIRRLQSDGYNHHNIDAAYSFPVDVIIHRFMKSSNVHDEYAGMEGLKQLYLQYCKGKKKLGFSLEELIDDNWIRFEFGEWRPTVSYMNTENLDEIVDTKLRDVLRFLVFLRNQMYDSAKYAIIDNPQAILDELLEVFPDIPSLEWFVEEKILITVNESYAFENERWTHAELINKAAAQMWMFDIDRKNIDDKIGWLNKACACNVTEGMFKHIANEPKAELLKWLIELANDEPWIGNFEREGKIYARYALTDHYSRLIEKTYDKIDEAMRSPRELIEWLHRNDRYFSRKSPLFNFRGKMHLVVDGLFRNFYEIPNSNKDDAALILFRLLKSGFYSRSDHADAISIIDFTQHGQTQFLSVYMLLENCNSVDVGQHEDILFAFDKIFEYILKGSFWHHAPHKAEPEQISLIFRYLISLCSFFEDENEHQQVQSMGYKSILCKKLMNLLIDKIKKAYRLIEPIVERVIADLSKGLKKYDNHSAARQIAGLICIANKFYFSDIPLHKDGLYKKILSKLNQFIQGMFGDNAKYSEIYISSEFWCSPMWLDVYLSANDEEREVYRTPISRAEINNLSSDITSNEFRHARKRAIIQTGISCSAAMASERVRFSADDAVKNELTAAFYECVRVYQTSDKFDIFQADWLDLLKSRAIFSQVGKFVSTQHHNWTNLKKDLENRSWHQLLLWLDFAVDEDVHKDISNILNAKLLEEPPLVEWFYGFGMDVLIEVILRQGIEALYDCASAALQQLEEKIAEYEKGAVVSQRLKEVRNWINEIHYRQRKHELIQQSGDSYYIAHLLLDDDEHLGAYLAFERLLKIEHTPRVFLNLLYCNIVLLEKSVEANRQDDFSKHMNRSASIIEKAESFVMNWSYEERLWFAEYLVARNGIANGESEGYTKQVETRYAVAIESKKEIKELVPSAEFLTSKPISSDLGQFVGHNFELDPNMDVVINRLAAYSFMDKSKLFTKHKGIRLANDDAAREIVLLKCTLDTLSSIHNFSTQMLIKGLQPIPGHEDRYTELFREIFNRAYGGTFGVICVDQNKRGPTGSPLDRGGGIAEVDMTFMASGNVITFGEAIILSGIDKTNIQNHINKLIATGHRSNSHSLFFVIYYCDSSPVKFWNDYKQYVCNSFEVHKTDLIKPCFETTSFERTEIYDAVRGKDVFVYTAQSNILCSSFEYADERKMRIYHIFVDICDYRQSAHAKASRGKKNS